MRYLLPAIILASLLSAAALAQDVKPDTGPTPQAGGNLLQQLGLTADQLRQIRQLNQSRKPQMEEAQLRVREANKALDEAIYADQVDETAVKARLEDLQRAQADVARVRFTSELAIRRILTPDQLGHFREMRQRAAEVRETLQERRRLKIKDAPPADTGQGRPLRRQSLLLTKPPRNSSSNQPVKRTP